MKIIINTSTFKQSQKDPSPSFINDLICEFSKSNHYYVMFPKKTTQLKNKNIFKNIKLLPYFYLIPRKFSNISENGILPSLKKNPLNIVKVILLILSQFFHLTYFVIKIKPDFVYSHWVFPQAFISSVVCKIFKIKHVFTSHGSDVSILNNFGKFGLFIKNFTLNNSVRYTTVSSLACEKLQSNTKGVVAKNYTIPMGINKEFFITKFDKNENLDQINLLYFGRITKYKGVDLIIRACNLLKNDGLSFHLNIIGNGDFKQNLLKLADRFSLLENINFLDYKNRNVLIDYIDESDLVIIPSIENNYEFEAGPLSYLEGMSRKKLCIISSSIGFAEHSTENNSIIFNSGDYKDLYEKILYSTKLSKKEKEIIATNAFITSKKFSFNLIGKNIESFLFNNSNN